MADKQLERVAKWERDKEDELARFFRDAQQHAQMQQTKLKTLEQYRLDYLRQTQSEASKGVGARHFNQQLSFIGKLDKACEMQIELHKQALRVVEQRKQQWLKQQQKRKAVELLLEKKAAYKQAKEARVEQQMMDELATQKFVRRK